MIKGKPILLATLTASWGAGAAAQCDRWQQRVQYEMSVSLNDQDHSFQGKTKLVYTNNSPDTLREVFFHLYFNAFQPGSEMDVRSRKIGRAHV
mgnify:FL=1